MRGAPANRLPLTDEPTEGEATISPSWMVAGYLGAIGIKLKVRTMERAPFPAARAAKQLRGLCICGTDRYGNAAVRIEEAVISGGTYAYGGYLELDDLFRQQDVESDVAKREVLLHRIQRIMHERVVVAPLFLYVWPSGIGPRVQEPALWLINPSVVRAIRGRPPQEAVIGF